jgi:predicted component of type VI protein secretion system
MPKFEVIRKGVTPAARPVPTDTTLLVLPMTPDRVGREIARVDEQPLRIDGVNDAFEKFKPSLHFETEAGEDATEFVADFEFRSLKDFTPENIQKKTPGLRNDLADLKNTIDLLYRMKDRWSLPSVKRAWNNKDQREQILNVLATLRAELEKIASEVPGGEK